MTAASRHPAREPGQPDINPARLATDPLLAEIAEMVGYMDLHIGRHEIKQMSTRQKELWADLVDADAVASSLEEDDPEPRRTVRWWRDYRRPLGEEGHAHGEQAVCRGCGQVVTWDADMEKFWIPYGTGNPTSDTFHCVRGPLGEPHWALPSGAEEPDPFAYDDEQTDSATASEPRTRGADQPVHVDEDAVRVARHALLGLTTDSPHWLRRHDDFAAVYEWAKQAVRPLRMSLGPQVGQVGTLRTYPSPHQADEYLAAHRKARATQ